jgi:trehalose-phosphatase
MSRPFSFPLFNKLLKRAGFSSENNKPLSLFLDFDGTLTPVAGHPDDAFLSKSMRDILIALNERYRVAIITGRALDDIMGLVKIEGLTYVGNHGMEMSGGDFSFIYDIGPVESEAIARVAKLIVSLVDSYDGAVIEEKVLTLSIHYRLLPANVKPLFLERLEAILSPFLSKGLIKVTGGKGLVEIRPTADWDKGSAVEWLLPRSGFKGSTPLCVGDDVTDEDAFRVLRGKGVSIFVGRRKSRADLYLPGQSGVEAMLAFLAAR